MRFHRLSSVALLLLVAGALGSAGALGQEPPQPIVNLQLNFSDPGARSLGFGGAFIGLADDATAAFANPAGLVQLGRPEVSIEVRPRRPAGRPAASDISRPAPTNYRNR